MLSFLSEKAMAPHSSTLAWKIPWMEEPGGLPSMRSRIVGHDWATSLSRFTFMHWGRKWQPAPVFSQGWGSLVGCRLWGCTELDMTEAAAAAAFFKVQLSHPYMTMDEFHLFTNYLGDKNRHNILQHTIALTNLGWEWLPESNHSCPFHMYPHAFWISLSLSPPKFYNAVALKPSVTLKKRNIQTTGLESRTTQLPSEFLMVF